MIDYSSLYERLSGTPLESWGNTLPALIEQRLSSENHGDYEKWMKALQTLPVINASEIDLLNSVTLNGDCTDTQHHVIETALRQLHPWRKGPFFIHGVHIDTEWRSDWKWDRLKDHITPLHDRTVLDVGCGSGYHCWRMAGAGAKLVIGIDPTPLYVMQYFALRHFIGDCSAYVLPLGIEDLPAKLEGFDTVFSMGVLYHRRSPLDHLLELRDTLRPGGELVLETLVIDGPLGQTLMPEGRYAKMRNVWFIPSHTTLELWLQRCGFKNIRTVDVTTTSLDEQRSTGWMEFESLKDFLMADDTSRTCEGYPAPRRAVVIANRV
jgi:tRNA (mo5U34)-methyltransferase